MNEKTVKKNSFKAWLLASRPKTLTACVVPVMMALALAYHDNNGQLDVLPAVLCILFAMVMQIDANFVNDYFDWRRGNDDEATRLGPLRACSQGWVSPRAMIVALVVTTCIGGMVGLPLAFIGGWEMILVGVACVIFCILYTTTLSYIAMGDVLVLVFFGFVPLCCTYFLQTQTVTPVALWLSLACGLVIDCLLIINNYRDVDNDKRDGKRTLIVFIGRKGGEVLYFACGIIAAVIILWFCHFSRMSFIAMGIYLFLHLQAHRNMKDLTGRELNKVLGMTARNIFIFGLLSSLVVLL